jgi:transposase-like protein
MVGMVEKTPLRRMILIPVKKRNGETLMPLIKKYVHPESIIHTDKWRGYNGLSSIGFTHYSVNHSKHKVDPLTGAHTNSIEGKWSDLKTKIPKRYRTLRLIRLFLLVFMLQRNAECDPFHYLLTLL